MASFNLKRPDPAVLRLLVFGGGLVIVTVLLIVFSDIFLPLLLGLGVAYLLDPVVSWLERQHHHAPSRITALADQFFTNDLVTLGLQPFQRPVPVVTGLEDGAHVMDETFTHQSGPVSRAHVGITALQIALGRVAFGRGQAHPPTGAVNRQPVRPTGR